MAACSVTPSTPVNIVTGFLGAGKTTMINRMVRAPELSNAAVIVNEFGEIGLDHLLIEQGQDRVVLLESGCLCCDLSGSLRETLADLYQRRANASVPAFSHVLIETSGLAQPGPIVDALLHDPLISGRFEAGGVCCMVDALNAPTTFAAHIEAREQAAFADVYIVTKAGTADARQNAETRALLTSINPDAPCFDAENEDFDPAVLIALPPVTAPGPEHVHAHESDIAAHALEFPGGASRAGIAAWTDHLRARWGFQLLRVKALIDLAGAAGPALVQGVCQRFVVTMLDAWPNADRVSRIIVIGHRLERQTLQAGVAWLRAPANLSCPGDSGFPPWAQASEPR